MYRSTSFARTVGSEESRQVGVARIQGRLQKRGAISGRHTVQSSPLCDQHCHRDGRCTLSSHLRRRHAYLFLQTVIEHKESLAIILIPIGERLKIMGSNIESQAHHAGIGPTCERFKMYVRFGCVVSNNITNIYTALLSVPMRSFGRWRNKESSRESWRLMRIRSDSRISSRESMKRRRTFRCVGRGAGRDAI